MKGGGRGTEVDEGRKTKQSSKQDRKKDGKKGERKKEGKREKGIERK